MNCSMACNDGTQKNNKKQRFSKWQLNLNYNTLENLRPRPHYAGGIWKQRFHSENASQMFSVHTTPEEFKNGTIASHFGFVFEENSVREITWLSWRHRFRKVPFSNCFPSTRKRKAGVFKFLRFEEHFRKAPFSWRLSVDARPNRRNKAAFFKFLQRSVRILPDKGFHLALWGEGFLTYSYSNSVGHICNWVMHLDSAS